MKGYPPDNTTHQPTPVPKSTLGKRLGWLVLIWLASVFALGMVSLLIKLFMKSAGFYS